MSSPAVVTLASCPVAYKILYKSPASLKGDEQGWAATIDFLVAMSDQDTFCQWAAGLLYYITVGGASVGRYIPLSHPEHTGLLCKGIDAQATGYYTSSNDFAYQNWSHSKVRLTFKSVPYPADGSTPFLVTRTRASAQEYTLAGKRLTFGDGTPIQADASVAVPTMTYLQTLYQCPAIDDTLVASLLAAPVSSTTMTLGSLSAAAGLVRFDSMDTETTMLADGTIAYQRTLYLSYRPVDWNKFLKSDGTWDYPTKPDSSYVYGTSDLTQLFT